MILISHENVVTRFSCIRPTLLLRVRCSTTHEGAMPNEAAVVIIGGGIFGCSIAYHLAKKGARHVVLLEKTPLLPARRLWLPVWCKSYTSLPFAIWLLRAFFQSIPLDIEEAAWMDGADRLRAIIYVILPLSLPGVIATSIFTFIVSWNDYLFALVLMTEEEMRTLPVGLGDLLNRAFIDWGVIMAAAMLITLPALVFFILTQNFLIRGWGAGAVKE